MSGGDLHGSFLPRPIFEPHAERNAGAIGDVLERHLPETGAVLEIASGTGQHAVTFAARFPGLTWLTSDPWVTSRESTNGWIIKSGLANVRPPMDIDVTEPGWADAVPRPVAAIYASNLLHISPWAVTCGLFHGAGGLLADGAPVCIYGCFKRDGTHLSEANIVFDRNISGENPEWGVRDLEAVEEEARTSGFMLAEVVDMPRENLMLIFRRGTRTDGVT